MLVISVISSVWVILMTEECDFFQYRLEDVKWHVKNGTLHHILPLYNSGVEVTSYDSKTGEKLKGRKVSAPFIDPETQ